MLVDVDGWVVAFLEKAYLSGFNCTGPFFGGSSPLGISSRFGDSMDDFSGSEKQHEGRCAHSWACQMIRSNKYLHAGSTFGTGK